MVNIYKSYKCILDTTIIIENEHVFFEHFFKKKELFKNNKTLFYKLQRKLVTYCNKIISINKMFIMIKFFREIFLNDCYFREINNKYLCKFIHNKITLGIFKQWKLLNIKEKIFIQICVGLNKISKHK